MIASILPKVAGLEEHHEKYRIRPSGVTVIHQGEVHGRCPRATVYDRLGFEAQPMPGRAVILLEDSSFHEILTADWIRLSPYRLHSEQMGIDCFEVPGITLPAWHCGVCHQVYQRVIAPESCQLCRQPGNRLHGHIDGILMDLEGAERVYEHKAINHFSFQRIWDHQELPISYIAQPCCYLIGLKKLLVDLTEILLVIKNKMTAQYLDILIEYDVDKDVAYVKEMEHSGYGKRWIGERLTGLVGSAIEEWQKTERYYQQSKEAGRAILPLRPFEQDSWQCSYCLWAETCWAGYEEEFKNLEENAELGEDFRGVLRDETVLAAEESVVKRKRQELRGNIRKWLKMMECKSGRAGPFTVETTLDVREKVDLEQLYTEVSHLFGTDRLEQFAKIWKDAHKKNFVETLRVREEKGDRPERRSKRYETHHE